uniref:Uncharacterized protein n=2 Tax=Homalodisca liturata TaxID=320908 RepID=A0A1B6H538_9HEMI
MKDLKELNDLSSGGTLDTKHDSKKNSYSGASWSKPVKTPDSVSKTSQYQNEFLKHLMNSQSNTLSPAPNPAYSRHSDSPYENSPYLNEINKSVLNSSPHLSAQSMSSLAGSPGSKITQMNQGCIMKALPNTGISSGNPHRFITQMDYGTDNQHLLGLGHYGLAGWPYSGNEPQHQQ